MVGAGTPIVTTCARAGAETADGNRTHKQIKQTQEHRFQMKSAMRGRRPTGVARSAARASNLLLTVCFKQNTSRTSRSFIRSQQNMAIYPVTTKHGHKNDEPNDSCDLRFAILRTCAAIMARFLFPTFWWFANRRSPRSSASEGQPRRLGDQRTGTDACRNPSARTRPTHWP